MNQFCLTMLRSSVAVTCLCICAATCEPEALSAEGVVKVEMELVRKTVFAGEMPTLRITVTAPKQAEVIVIKAERAYITTALKIDLFTHSYFPRHRLGGGLGHDSYVKAKPADFFSLQPGESYTIEEPIYSRPLIAGSYTVKIKFSPGFKGKLEFEKSLRLTCREIPDRSILAKQTIPVLRGPQPEKVVEELQVMNVQTDNGCELIFRSVSLNYGLDYVTRLGAVEPSTRLIAVLYVPPNAGITSAEVWFTFNKDGQLFFGRVARATGQLLEMRPIEKTEKGK